MATCKESVGDNAQRELPRHEKSERCIADAPQKRKESRFQKYLAPHVHKAVYKEQDQHAQFNGVSSPCKSNQALFESNNNDL